MIRLPRTKQSISELEEDLSNATGLEKKFLQTQVEDQKKALVDEQKAKEAAELMERIIDGESESSPWFLNTSTRGFSAAHLTSPQTGKNNILYSFTTDLPTYGLRNTLKGIFGFLKNPYKSIERARERGQLGVGTREIKSITFGYFNLILKYEVSCQQVLLKSKTSQKIRKLFIFFRFRLW